MLKMFCDVCGKEIEKVGERSFKKISNGIVVEVNLLSDISKHICRECIKDIIVNGAYLKDSEKIEENVEKSTKNSQTEYEEKVKEYMKNFFNRTPYFGGWTFIG